MNSPSEEFLNAIKDLMPVDEYFRQLGDPANEEREVIEKITKGPQPVDDELYEHLSAVQGGDD